MSKYIGIRARSKQHSEGVEPLAPISKGLTPMKLPRAGVLSLLALCTLSAACSSKKGALKSDLGSPNDKRSEAIHQSAQGAEKVTELDLNHDGKPDVWEYTIKAKTAEGKEYDRLVRKEMDINWDGKVDVVRHYDENEQISKEELDLDFDGKIDQWNYYEKGVLVRKERDLDFNGKPDLWIYYEKGHIVRKERDTNHSGKVNYWEYWENDHVDRIGEDLNGDGQVDRWTKNPNPGG
jgi:antitoxin component YwqK of YwqJK toxin-antitoxin module